MASKNWGNYSVMDWGNRTSYIFHTPRTSAHIAGVRAIQQRFRYKRTLLQKKNYGLKYRILGWRRLHSMRRVRTAANRYEAKRRLRTTRNRELAWRRLEWTNKKRMSGKELSAWHARHGKKYPSLYYLKSPSP